MASVSIFIDINNLIIDINKDGCPAPSLLISITHFWISINARAIFVYINNSFMDINKPFVDINKSFIDINKDGCQAHIY